MMQGQQSLTLHWCSIDAQIYDKVAMLLQAFLYKNVGNSSIMG